MRQFHLHFDRYAKNRLFLGICVYCFTVISNPAKAQLEVIEPKGFIAVSEYEVSRLVKSWVFGGKTTEDIRQDMQKLAELKLDQLDHFCNLTAEQRCRLKIATTGDATRFLHDVTKLGRKLGREFEGKDLGDQELIRIFRDCSMLNARLHNGLYRRNSLLEKVLVSVLDEQQIKKYNELQAQEPV